MDEREAAAGMPLEGGRGFPGCGWFRRGLRGVECSGWMATPGAPSWLQAARRTPASSSARISRVRARAMRDAPLLLRWPPHGGVDGSLGAGARAGHASDDIRATGNPSARRILPFLDDEWVTIPLSLAPDDEQHEAHGGRQAGTAEDDRAHPRGPPSG